MTEEQFCKLYSQYYGEKITDVNQLIKTTLSGKELFDFCVFINQERSAIALLK